MHFVIIGTVKSTNYYHSEKLISRFSYLSSCSRYLGNLVHYLTASCKIDMNIWNIVDKYAKKNSLMPRNSRPGPTEVTDPESRQLKIGMRGQVPPLAPPFTSYSSLRQVGARPQVKAAILIHMLLCLFC